MSQPFIGLIAALTSAIADSLNQVSVKGSKDHITPTALATFTITGIAILYSPFLFTHAPDHVLPYWFWGAIAFRGFVEAEACISYFSALQDADVSLSAPLTNLKPLFILIIILAFGLQPWTVFGIVGMLCIMIGAIWLQRKPGAGLRAIFSSSVGKRMLYATLIWAIGDCILIRLTEVASVPYCSATATIAFSASLLIYAFIWKRSDLRAGLTAKGVKFSALAIVTDGVAFYAMLQGYALWNASYVASIRYTSAVFTVIIAVLVLHENVRKRLLPIALMIVGSVIIALFS